MPKVSLAALPVSALFAVAKPSGPASMTVINDIKQLVAGSRLFVEAEKLEERKRKAKHNGSHRGKRTRDVVKIGQGGTLDPLADGVLVVGVGKGTKRLNDLLEGVKEYRATALLGCETDTYDSEGARVCLAPWHHVTKENVESALEQFRGEILQTPPIFSALKMDGKPLYEYARKGIPLPRPIEKRKVTIYSLDLIEWKGDDHTFRWPEKQFSAEEKKAMEMALGGVEENPSFKDEPDRAAPDQAPTAFVLSMKVSGGSYVRSIVHDLGRAVGSSAHVVTLTRTRQSRFTLNVTEPEDKGCVPWEIFQKALEEEGEADEDGWKDWERAVMDKLEIIDGKKTT